MIHSYCHYSSCLTADQQRLFLAVRYACLHAALLVSEKEKDFQTGCSLAGQLMLTIDPCIGAYARLGRTGDKTRQLPCIYFWCHRQLLPEATQYPLNCKNAGDCWSLP